MDTVESVQFGEVVLEHLLEGGAGIKCRGDEKAAVSGEEEPVS